MGSITKQPGIFHGSDEFFKKNASNRDFVYSLPCKNQPTVGSNSWWFRNSANQLLSYT